MSLNQPANNSSFKRSKNGSKLKKSAISLATNISSKSTVNLINTTSLKTTRSTIQSMPCNLTTTASSKVLTTNDVLPNLPSFNHDLQSMFTSHYEPHNLSIHQSKASNHMPLNTQNSKQQPQQFKVEQKNSQYYLMPTSLTTLNKSSSTMDQFLNLADFNTTQLDKLSLDKRTMNKELVDILLELKKLTVQLEKRISGRLNEVDLIVKQE